jgi:RHS repeat-associated protein
VTSRLLYDAYGNTRSVTGAVPTAYRYTGQRLDDTGLYFMNARYYSSAIGRFISADAIVPDGEHTSIVPLTVDFHEPQILSQLNAENRITLEHGFWFQLTPAERHDARVHRGPYNPQDLNRYAYVRSNPLKHTDLSGHCIDACVISGPVLVLGIVVIGLAWTIGEYYGWGPNAAGNNAALAASIEAGVDQVANGINALFAKKRDIRDIERLLDKYGITDRALRRKIHDEYTRKLDSLEEWEEAIADIAERLKQEEESDSSDDE